MRGAKAVNLITRIVRVVGIVLLLTALVLFLYATINTGGRWRELSDDMASFGVNTNIVDRARFDDQLFSAMSNAVSRNAEMKLDPLTALTPQQQDALDETVRGYFDAYYQRARNGLTSHYANEAEDVYRWFQEEFDAAAFVRDNSNIEVILQNHEISEIQDYLQEVFSPKKVPPKGKPDQKADFDQSYQDYRAAKGKEVGSRFEFYSVVKVLITEDLASGEYNNKTTIASAWWKAKMGAEGFDALYQDALAKIRVQEAREGDDNYIVQLLALATRQLEGEQVDYRAFLDGVKEELEAAYPAVKDLDPHVFLLAVRNLTESILPGAQAEEEEDAAAEGAGETTAAEGTEEAAQAAETALVEEEEEIEDDEEIALDPNRFDGSLIRIRDEMIRIREDENKNSPDARETVFVQTVVKDARERSSIGMAVAYFWAIVAKYFTIFAVGLALVLLAAAVNKLMQHVLLTRKDSDDLLIKAKSPEQETAPEQPEAFGSDVLLRVSHLKQYFRSGSYVNKAVDDISFYVKKGEVFGLVGESGCGKTTTGRTIINLYDPTEGDVYFEGLRISSNLNGLPVLKKSLNNDARQAIEMEKAKLKEAIAREPARAAVLKEETDARIRQIKADLKTKLSNASTNALISFVEKGRAVNLYREHRKEQLTKQFKAESAKLSGAELAQATQRYERDMKIAGKDNIMSKMQMIFQDPIASINPRMTVREIIAEGLVIQGVKDKAYINEKVNEMLERVGLVREHADRYPHEFSGGQRQRIGIARAIIMNPDLIIADEPISALDVSIQAQVINLLNDLRSQMGLTIMFIAHNLSVVKYFSDRIAVMYYGKIVEMTTSDELFAHPLHPYTKSLLSAIPYPDPHYEKTRQRIEYNPAKAHDYSVDKPSLREITPGHYIYCNDTEFAQYQKELGL